MKPFDKLKEERGSFIVGPIGGGSGGGAVDSVNGQVGVVVLNTDDIADTSTNAYVPLSTLTARSIVGTGDPVTDIISIPGMTWDATTGGLRLDFNQEPDGGSGVIEQNHSTVNIEPLSNSPNVSGRVLSNRITLDPNSSGFTIGTAGRAATITHNFLQHNGTSDVGDLAFTENYANIGNGTDAIDVGGLSYSYGFGDINANATLVGPVQGYGFQPNFQAGSAVSSSTFVSGFYDALNASTLTMPNYVSFSSSPNLGGLAASSTYTGLRINPTIGSLASNAGIVEASLNGTYGSNGLFYQGLSITPTITLVNNNTQAVGLNVSMDNVTEGTGVASSLVFQDITYTFVALADNNVFTLEYLPGGTAGSEVVAIAGTAITVQIESGVSTATQVKAAWDLSPAAANVNAVISGTASNPQVTDGPTNFTGGENPGNKLAAFLDGDVQITGGLSFGGALSIGQLSAFFSQPLVNGGGQPTSTHTAITAPTVAPSVSVSSADYIGVNTAMLLNIGANAVVTTSFLGVLAMGLPAVVTMGAGSTIDRIGGGGFALSLEATAGGGTINVVSLCRSLAIPNGVTTVNRLYGYEFSLPFGDPGTDTWGLYIEPDAENWLRGSLRIGGTAGSDDQVTNSSVGIEIGSTTKSFLNARMTTTEKNALTAVAGMQVYDSTLNQLSYYNGTSWVNI